MRNRIANRFVWVSLLLITTEVALNAQEPKEVPYPKMPKGAGKMDDKAPKTFTKTNSGLQYRVLRKGTGKNPTAANKVKVNYHGWLESGKVFDSSYDRNEPISFPLSGVIKGWTEGMQLVGEGGMIELDIPSELAYGSRPPAGADIPPNTRLHFLVELLKLE